MDPVPHPSPSPSRPPSALVLIPLGILGWIGTAWLVVSLYATDPRTAGFDLELLLVAGRRIAAGLSPYDPGLISGASPAAPSLFYSYPPPVAQATSLVAGIPTGVVLVAWDVAAVIGLLIVSDALRRLLAPDRRRVDVLLPVVCIAPFVFPFSIGLLFGNADVFFPFLYGIMLVGALEGTRGGYARSGLALALASLKLHPASLGLWFAGLGLRQRLAGRPPNAWAAIGVAVVVAIAILCASLIAGGGNAWADYVAVIRAGSGADIVDPRNAGPAAIIAGIIGGDSGTARAVQIPVTLIALASTFAVALRDDDVIESFAVAAVASLVMLPVTWYHYPAALMPVAIASLLRATDDRVRPTLLMVGGAVAVGTVAVAWLPLLWVAVAMVVAAARVSRPSAHSS